VFLFLRSNLWPSNEYLYINVYDEDEGKKPDLIGSAEISLDDVIEKGHFDDWVKLPGFFGFGSRGDVHIRMAFENASKD
jgi:Ca2+-dependent lipid-binding protein